jgi:hypothetical protein
VKLYVCWGTFPTPRPGGHPCANAYNALKDAGHKPAVERVYGLGPLPEVLNGPRRKKVKELSGTPWVPMLELDDGTIVDGSRAIADWAKAHPA